MCKTAEVIAKQADKPLPNSLGDIALAQFTLETLANQTGCSGSRFSTAYGQLICPLESYVHQAGAMAAGRSPMAICAEALGREQFIAVQGQPTEEPPAAPGGPYL